MNNIDPLKVKSKLQENIHEAWEIEHDQYVNEFRLIRKLSTTSRIEFVNGKSGQERSKLTRVPAYKHDEPYWIKEYVGVHEAELKARELAVLLEVQSRSKTMPHIASFYQIKPSSQTDELQLIMRDYGVTLADWNKVFDRSGDKDFFLPSTLLRIVVKILNALSELHENDFLHCDLKQDNICMPVSRLDTAAGLKKISGHLNLEDLHIIDLGFSLLPNVKTRMLWGKNFDAFPHGAYISPRFMAAAFLATPLRQTQRNASFDELFFMREWLHTHGHLEQAPTAQSNLTNLVDCLKPTSKTIWEKYGFADALHQLDWRVDFFSLARLIQELGQVAAQVSSPQEQKAMELLRKLPHELLLIHDDDLPQEKPHTRLCRSLEDFLREQRLPMSPPRFTLDLEKFCRDKNTEKFEAKAAPALWACLSKPEVEVAVKTENIQSAGTQPQPQLGKTLPWLKLGQWLFVPAVAVSVLYGTYTAWKDGKLFGSPKPAVQRLLEAFPQHPGAVAKASLHAGSADKPQSQFFVGDRFNFTVTNPLKQDAYLTVFAADSEDEQAQRLVAVMRNQSIAAWATVSFPDIQEQDDSWQIKGPIGKVRMVAVLTPSRISWPVGQGSATQGTGAITVPSYKDAQDITALFNCASQSGVAQQACQDARQNFAVSPVVTYEVVDNKPAVQATASPAPRAAPATTPAPAAVTKSSTAPAQAAAPQPKAEPAPQPSLLHGRYQIVAGGSEVKDVQTGLTWARCSVGQNWDGSTCAGEAKAITIDQAQKLAGNGWRVPTVRELHSLVWCSSGKTKDRDDPKDGQGPINNGCDGNYSRPTLRSDVFAQTPSDSYWTSSPYVGLSGSAWFVYFDYGYVNLSNRYDGDGLVRLVRASQ